MSAAETTTLSTTFTVFGLPAADGILDGLDDDLRYAIADATVQPRHHTATAELNYFYAALELTVALLATVGNAAVITVFCRERRLRKRTNYYIVSLAMADFLVGLLGIPFAILASVGLPRNLYGCLLTLSTLVVLCTISIFCLVAVSIDRYWAILYPLAYSRNVRTKTAIGIISVCWMFGIFIGFLPLLGWRSASSAGPTQACLFVKVMDYDYLVFLYFATIVLPALMLLLFYAHIYTVIMKQVRKTVTLNPSVGGGGTGGTGNKPHKPTLMSMSRSQGGTMLRVLGAARKREVKATQNLSVIVLFFMLCWLPLYTVNCIQAFCHDCVIPAWLMLFLIILSHLNSAMNPLLYAYHLKDFRAALKSLICGVFGVKVQQEEINYRFSVHSQNRMASRMEKRASSALQPKIYIDSPVYHRQQASSRTTSPTPSGLVSPHPQHLPHRHTAAGELHMWRILEVAAIDDTNGAAVAAVSAGLERPFEKHEYRFNYDPLDCAESHSAAVVTSPSGGSDSDASNGGVFDVTTAMSHINPNGDIETYRSLPVFFGSISVAAAVTAANSPGDAAVAGASVRRRSVTFNVKPSPANRRRVGGAAAAGDVFDASVLRLESQNLLEHERRAEARCRAVEELQTRVQPPVARTRRRRSRSTSFEVDAAAADTAIGRQTRQQKLSRSWSALHRAQHDGGAHKHSFS